VHITLVPYLKAAGEMKTKPSQQSVGILRSIGIFPDILICRCEHHMSKDHLDKLALFCNVDKELVIEEKDVDHSIYEVPLELCKQQLDVQCLKMLNLPVTPLEISDWEAMVAKLISPKTGKVEIAVVGKYISLRDAYKSIYEALVHGGIPHGAEISIRMVESEDVEARGAEALLSGCHGILIPGGFGDRGIEGKISAIQYARENGIPFFGICLGMQCAVIEFARNCCGLTGANSSEFNANSAHPVIHLMESQAAIRKKGGTMRLGAYRCQLKSGSLAHKAYGQGTVSERHRHRYEFNNDYRQTLEKQGLFISGLSPDGELVEMIEIPAHPWFIACQFHPEFQSTPLKAHPLFLNFIGAAMRNRDAKK
jgi:CTP synthase